MSTMKKKIAEVISLAKRDLESPNCYPFLPEIIESLENMQKNLHVTRDQRKQMAGGLGRLVTEDFNFSESELGTKMLQVINDFVK